MLRHASHVTTGSVTTGAGNEPPIVTVEVERGASFDEAWRDVRADGDLQFAELQVPEAEPPPDWLISLMEWLGRVFEPVARFFVAIWPVLMWVLIALAAALAIYLVVRIVDPASLQTRKKADAPDDWMPQEEEALALIEEADRLAAEGRFDEATHLLLKRSVGQIAAARPGLVEPSSTARELSAEPRLPEGARTAFSIIANRVERSLFALTALTRDDWQAARQAYADFALQQRALAA